MSQPITTHLLRYKNENDEWVDIPVIVSTMYNSYVVYCKEHDIPAVDETTYYETIGNLAAYVEALNDKAGNIDALVSALETGSLPLTQGGTGQSFANAYQLIAYLWRGLTGDPGWNAQHLLVKNMLVTQEGLDNVVNTLTTDLSTKLNINNIASGTKTPDEAGLATTVQYYFQYEQVERV